VLVFSWGSPTSGIPLAWAASAQRPGVSLLPDFSDSAARDIANQVRSVKQPGDVVVLSVHWGGNWGYGISSEERRFARRLLAKTGVDVVHGHSSHHPKAIEVYRGKLILYGCGDFINDYEGIDGYEAFRGDLGLMYFAEVDAGSGRLASLRMRATQLRRFQVARASPEDATWLAEVLSREGKAFHTTVRLAEGGELALDWGRA
ncbi:MAG: CapA family protein, partial [Deltaproteobacteria bacterium]|nr:CapA family protein [Deltaproteobacteria bacterium]